MGTCEFSDIFSGAVASPPVAHDDGYPHSSASEVPVPELSAQAVLLGRALSPPSSRSGDIGRVTAPVAYGRVPFDVEGYIDRATSGRDCFICRIARGEDDRHEIVYRDEVHMAFLNRYPTLVGYTLIAPVEHREQVVGDFSVDEYLGLQRLIYRIGQAMARVLPTERLYLLSLGSQAANAHVHWHMAALPPGVPYRDQQFAALMADDHGYLDIPSADLQALAARLRVALSETNSDG